MLKGEKINLIELQHMLSLPMFAIMPQSVRRGFVGLSRPKNLGLGGGYDNGHNSSSSIIRRPYTMLALNLLSQLICVAGVNQLSSVCNLPFFFPSFPY
jgi:solute carrier family 35 (UDP-xylose/UDP-N-acetylglucosamine transporter), member B4